MPSTDIWKLALALVFSATSVTQSGCQTPGQMSIRDSLTNSTKQTSDPARQGLLLDLRQTVGFVESETTSAADQITTASRDTDVKKAALLWKLRMIESMNHMQGGFGRQDPFALLLDQWIFTLRLADYFRDGDGKDLFGQQQHLALKAAARLQERAETIARRHLTEDKLPELIEKMESYAQDHPINGLFANLIVEDFSDRQEGLNWLDLTKTPFRAFKKVLDPTSSLALSLDRLTSLLNDYPQQVRWQTQLLWLHLENSPSIQTTLEGIEKLSDSAERLVSVSERLPDRVGQQVQIALDDFDARQPELRKTIAAVDQALLRAESVTATIERSLKDLTQAGQVWQATANSVTETVQQMQQLRNPTQGLSDAEGSPAKAAPQNASTPHRTTPKFDVNDYTRTANALSKSSEEVRALLAEVRDLLSGDDLSRIDALTASAVERTAVESRAVVDHITWRTAQISALVFALALIYRFTASRVARPRS